jgi:hypothetical protein
MPDDTAQLCGIQWLAHRMDRLPGAVRRADLERFVHRSVVNERLLVIRCDAISD